MIERYSREEMSNIWTDQNRYEAWLEVEILACEAWSELGHIPKADVQKIRQNAKVNVERAQEIEQETRHDVVAFTRQVSETLGEERKWVHYGLTSTDVVDTAAFLGFANNCSSFFSFSSFNRKNERLGIYASPRTSTFNGSFIFKGIA